MKSEEAALYWAQEAQKSIDVIHAEVERKQQRLIALEALEKVSSLVKVYTKTLFNKILVLMFYSGKGKCLVA